MPDFYKQYDKRKLEERSFLSLEFPQSNGRYLKAFIPFLENCKVVETGKANYSSYDLLGRSGSLYAYTGSKSRTFSLSFKINFLHLLDMETREGLSDKFYRSFDLILQSKEYAKQAFFALNNIAFSKPSPDIQSSKGIQHASLHREYYWNLIGKRLGTPGLLDSVFSFLENGINSLPEVFSTAKDDSGTPYDDTAFSGINKLIDLVINWINLIRATTLNNAQNTTQGPPIVRFNHGPMYNNIPCINEGYSIRIVDEAGFEMQTLLPKQLEITLDLKEIRTGNYNNFNAGKIGEADSVAGWEAIIENNNIDPYTGSVRP